jgi:hypothetical protein
MPDSGFEAQNQRKRESNNRKAANAAMAANGHKATIQSMKIAYFTAESTALIRVSSVFHPWLFKK